ncbi:MAG: bifunctional UDP-sugar hydrolase/5'-nucleotidase [Sporolactobacillus sp.]
MERLQFIILESSDVHGCVYPVNDADGTPKEAGLAKLATCIARERLRGCPTLLVDNGDLLQGAPLLYYYARFDGRRRNPMALAANAIGYDCAVFGNHEFNFGLDYLRRSVSDCTFPWLSANILDKTSGLPFFGTPYIIRDYPGALRVAVLGLTTKYVPIWEKPQHLTGLQFTDPVEAAGRWVPFLREEKHADLVVVSYHGGFERRLDTGTPEGALTGENQGYELCVKVPEIDVLLTGHQHRLIEGVTVNGVPVVQPGCEGHCLGKVTLQLERSAHRWQVSAARSELLPVEGVSAARETLRLTAPYQRDCQTWLDQPLGRINGDMRIHRPLGARLSEHPMIEWMNRVQMRVSGADISLTALFSDRVPGLPACVTMRDIMANYPYPNTLKVLRVSGADMRAALERSASYFTRTAGGAIVPSRTFTVPKIQHYNYDMWEGIDYVIDIGRPVGARVTRLDYKGCPVDDLKTYEVVMNNYRAGGGGDYLMFRGCPVVREMTEDMSELLAETLLREKIIQATADHNFLVVDGGEPVALNE